ncbi:hypothetical protein FA13DRAFT_1796185 [Coprinellus micaceus]|uniref:CHAT domain-containing protein n=1 Tax=Coprinellus micaceus TaxID=71717 RepID=A0A4Y7SVJ8_COPMI|nr:hypothetical protein FA13DRAFT_1796185 [Coprinellus micaceus]
MRHGMRASHNAVHSRAYMTDIFIDRANNDGQGEDGVNLTELCVFGLNEAHDEEAKSFSLTPYFLAKLAIDSHSEVFYRLTIGLILSVRRIEMSKQIETFDAQLQFNISWDMIEMPAEAAARGRELPTLRERIQFSTALYDRFQSTGEINIVSAAIAALKRAVDMTSEDDVNLPVALGNLGNCFYARYEYTGSLQDLADAISAQRRTVQLSPGDDGDLPAYLINLGNLLQCRFNVAGDLGDISEAISVQQRAIYSTPKGHPYLPARLNNLGNSLSSRFRSTAHLPDIVEAILAHKRGMELISEGSGHPHLPALLNGLASSLRYRFNHTGDLEDLAEAISAQRRAVHLVPRNRDPHDISEAVSEQRRAVDLTPEGHVQLPIRLNSLVISLQSRFRHARDIQDLDESILVQRRAILPTKEDHVNLPVYLNNLGISYMLRFGESGDLPDIDGAISAQRKALSFTPMGSAQRSAQYTNLGNSFLARYQQTGNVQDIAGALLAHQRAVELVPEGHVCLPLCLKNLANCWYNRSASGADPGHLEKSISSYRTAAMCAVGSPSIKLSAAMTMISLVAGLEETIQRRYTLIQEYSGLSLEAATAALRLERPDKALEWLEQGTLPRMEPAEAMGVARRLEHAASSSREPYASMNPSDRISLEDEARDHVHLAGDFEDFLRPTPFSALVQYLPTSGFLVVVNVHENRCDAIALRGGSAGAVHIPLPLFSLEKANKYRNMISSQLHSQGVRGRGDIFETEEEDGNPDRALMPPSQRTRPQARCGGGIRLILGGLWKELVKPILNKLGVLKGDPASNVDLPRIWWCPTGPLTFLPIQAAGIYQGQGAESILDYVIPSFTPTLSALTSRVKEGCGSVGQEKARLLLTCQPMAPGASSISGTVKEVRAIYDMAMSKGIRVTKLEGDALTAKQCIAHLEELSSIHLACHASQNTVEPLLSRFLFHDGQLNLKTIAQRRLTHADLAFLSACQTSTGEETLSEEAVHLAAGMLAAGYRRVVATMWAIDDRYAPQVAEDFYQYIWNHRGRNDGSRFDGTLSAHALHHAIQQLRGRLDNLDTSLLIWSPYIHYGY